MGQEEVPGHVEAGGDGRAEQEGGGLEQGGAEAASINLRKNLDGTKAFKPISAISSAESTLVACHPVIVSSSSSSARMALSDP